MSSASDVTDLADIPPGPALSAALAQVDLPTVPNDRVVEVLLARSRQLAHEQAQLFAALHQVARCDVGAAGRVARSVEPHEWAGGETAAALAWTPSAADRELCLAEKLIEQLPLVFAALSAGRLDRAKAWVFAHHLDPDWLTAEQIDSLCARYGPPASGWTTRQLAARLQRAILAIDPAYARRRYERAVRERAVHHWLDPAATVTITGTGLSVEEAAAACARLDRLATTIRRAGHPRSLAQISADLYVGMLNGLYAGLTDTQIVARLLHDTLNGGDVDGRTPTDEPNPPAEPSPPDEPSSGEAPIPRQEPTADDDFTPGGARSPRLQPERRPIRDGVEIRVGLATLIGLDDRPGEVPGLGPVLPGVARRLVAAQRSGAEWRFAVVDDDGHLLLAGLTRRRPRLTAGAAPDRCRGGIVELHVSAAQLRHLAGRPSRHRAWAGIIADLADQYAHRDVLLADLDARPDDRFAHAALARHIQVRDRTCSHVSRTRPARSCDLDHTRNFAQGGTTTRSDLGPGCLRHHLDKHVRYWQLRQPRPGHFVWRSPLGRVYRTRGEPIMPPLPPPAPTPASRERPTPPESEPRPPPDALPTPDLPDEPPL